MSAQLINHNSDLMRLRDEGFEISFVAGYLVLHSVPYVDAECRIRSAMLVSEVKPNGEFTVVQKDHVMMFSGSAPCDANGVRLDKIINSSSRRDLGGGLVIDHTFSSKPVGAGCYADFYEKFTAYVAMVSGPAEAIDPTVTARTRRVIKNVDEKSPFVYIDTATTRAQIGVVTQKLKKLKVAIVGVGGTGAYVLDQVAKTPVDEIHLIDPDAFLQHNAFRAPGAASMAELSANPLKVDYWAAVYSKMHRGIYPHPVALTKENVHLLDDVDFAFLCLDAGRAKAEIIKHLEQRGISFVDVGMGVELVNDELIGVVRVTTSTAAKRQHVRGKNRIPLEGDGNDNLYEANIQVADLNMLNAALAVIKWKKLYHFYMDLEGEHFSAFTLDGNHLLNEDNDDDDEEDAA